jgi:aminodeoxyfutalosine deaminase
VAAPALSAETVAPGESWRDVPRVELHVHLEGSLDAQAVLELAERNGLRLPWSTPQEMAPAYRFRDFAGFKRLVLLTARCLRRADDFVFAVERLGAALAVQRVRYAEVTVTPQFYARDAAAMQRWLDVLNEGRRRVRRDRGIELRWIPDIVRSVPRFAEAVAAWACSDRARDGGVVALGLGGPEPDGPAASFADVFRWARERGLPANPHAGEGTGAAGVRAALEHLAPARIGHGVGAAEDPDLMSRLADRGMPLEVCITSNLRLGLYADARSHPVRTLVDAGCIVTLNTDDPALFGTTLDGEFELAAACGLTQRQLAQCARNALRAAYDFSPGTA